MCVHDQETFNGNRILLATTKRSMLMDDILEPYLSIGMTHVACFVDERPNSSASSVFVRTGTYKFTETKVVYIENNVSNSFTY